MYSSPVLRSMSMAWRWVNVPRRESCPDSRTGTPVEDERAEREQLGGGPVDVARAGHRDPAVDLRLEPRVHGEALGRVGVGLGDALDRSRAATAVVTCCDGVSCSMSGSGAGLAGGVAGLDEHLLQLRLEVLERGLGVLEGDVAAADQRLGVELPDAALVVDDVVHQRLGERRVVGLVVAAPPVADHVDDDVLLELAAVLDRELGHPHARLGVVAVHVEDRRRDHPGDVGGSRATSATTDGEVVKPTWLLTTTCTVPPVR